MKYPTCKTCLYWEHQELHDGLCKHPKMGCNNPDALNASTYGEQACFYNTGQDFGCILHEANE